MTTRKMPAWEPLESRRLLTTVAEFPMHSTRSSLNDVTAGPDGNVWFTDAGTNSVGLINPTTHAVTEFALPTANAGPYDITSGPGGDLWFTENHASQIGRIDPSTHKIAEFSTPTHNAGPEGIVQSGDDLAFTEDNVSQIGMFDADKLTIHEYAIPTANGYPSEITAAPDGTLWFTENAASANQLGQFDPGSHLFAAISLPTTDAFPIGIAAGRNGWIWFTEYGANQIGFYNPAAHVITDFPAPTADSAPGDITLGPDGQLWFAESTGRIGVVNPNNQAITEYTIPTKGGSPTPFSIAPGPDGNLWFNDNGTDSLGVAVPDTQLALLTQPPNVAAGQSFGVVVVAKYLTGVLDPDFNGPVTISMANDPGNAQLGGQLTVNAQSGVAGFTALSIANPGTGYTLRVGAPSTTGLASVVTGAFNVTATAATGGTTGPGGSGPMGSIPPTIAGEQVVTIGKGRRRRVVGIELVFSESMNASSANASVNYTLTQAVKHGRRVINQPVGLTASYADPGRSVTLTFRGKPRFLKGGQLVVVGASPGGLESATGVYLDGEHQGKPGDNGVFTILPKASRVTA